MSKNKNIDYDINDDILNPLIKPNSIEIRSYQKNIAESSRGKNTLVILPTALGKTVISALICSDVLYDYKNKRVLVMAPTRPLVAQHEESFSSILKIPQDQKYVITGKIPPNNRHLIWGNEQLRIVFATPEIVKNDVLENRINLDDFGILVFDEAHRAVKDYAYTLIAKEYVEKAKYPIILATTASPGANRERIEELCKTLHIEHIEYRNEDDYDVKSYVNPINVQWKFFDLPGDYSYIVSLLKSMLTEKLKRLIQNGLIKKSNIDYIFKKDLLELGEQLRNSLRSTYAENKGYVYSAIVSQSIALSLMYCIELIESQGSFSLQTFLARLETSDGKSHNILMKDYRMQKIKDILNKGLIDHPKLRYILDLLKSGNKKIFEYMEINEHDFDKLKSQPDKILIFTHYRDTAKHIVNVLSDNGIESKRFVGQSSRDDDEGMKQELQANVLNAFRKGEFKVLVATSIAEEGLDIPEVDLVIFYEPISSEIRYIQRRGRTGRKSAGSVIILAANNTVDIRLLHASKRKVEKMRLLLNSIKLVLNPVYRTPPPINRMSNEEIRLLEGVITKKNNQIDIVCDDCDDVSNKIKASEFDKPKIPIKDLKKLDFSHKNRSSQKQIDSSKELLQNFNRKVDKASRNIYNKLLRSKSQISYHVLKENLALEEDVIKDALRKLQKKKLIKLYDNNNLISFNRENISKENGKIYDIKIEKLFPGKASVLVNGKWYARLNNYDYVGPSGILKKGSEFRAICEIYRNESILCIRIKQVVV